MQMPEIKTGGEGFGYTEEEWLFRQNLRKFCEEKIDPRFRENFNEEQSKVFYHEAMQQLGEQGFLRVWVPEQFGGFGQRLTYEMILTEEVSRACGGLAINAMENGVLGANMARASKVAWEKYGEDILSGKKILAAAMCSPEGQCNYPEQADLGRLEGDEWVLNGEKAYSSGGTLADVLMVAGMVKGTQYRWIMEPGTPGLTVTSNPEMGTTPTYATLTLNNVRISKEMSGPSNLVFDNQPNVSLPSRAFPLMVCALAMGSMGAAFDKTVEYLKHRTSNFKPIASLGSIQYKLAKMNSEIEAARSIMLIATQHLENNHKDGMLYVALAKRFVCDTAREITSECVQMHGCIGYNPETGIERYARDAMGFGIGVCTSDMHLVSAAKYMGLPGAEWECM